MRGPALRRFGENLRRLRLRRALTQEALAELSDCHPNYIGGIERGERNPTLTKLLDIARGLRCAPAELLAGLQPAGKFSRPRAGDSDENR